MIIVGYGDMVFKIIFGRIIGGVCVIFGVFIVVLFVFVIGNNFFMYYFYV